MLALLVLLYFAATLLIGYLGYRRNKSTVDFAVAGRSMPGYITAFALFATWYGSETILGSSSEFLKHGLHGIIEDPFGAALCLLLVGLFYVRPLYRKGYISLGEFIKDRFDARNEKLFSVLLVLSYLSWIAGQFTALGILIELIFGVPFQYAVFLSFGIVTIFTTVGGMWAISISDFIQSLIIISGMLLALYFLTDKAGGWDKVWQAIPAQHLEIMPEKSFREYLYAFASLLTLGLGSIPSQDIFQRLMTAKSEKTAVRATFAGAGMYLILSMLPLLIAVCSMIILNENVDSFDAQHAVPKVILSLDNLLVKALFFGALISAVISTASAALLAPAVVLGENLIKPQFPEITEKKLLIIMRSGVVVLGLAALGLTLWKGNIFELVALSSSFTLVSLFVPLTLGLFWKKTTNAAAYYSMVIGMITWIFAEIWVDAIPPLFVGLLCSLFTAIAMSLFSIRKES